jgi:N-methylhydantoinase B
MFKMFIGVYLIMVNDPQILFNDGFYPLLHVVMPEGTLLNPHYPAALGCRTHGLARLFDVLGGALCKQAPELNTAAGYGTSPYMLYSGWDSDGAFYYAMEILYGGIPGRPIGDGMDGHSWWPLFENIPTEYLEAYYPLRVDGYTTVTDSGGAGLHRGGNGVEKRYVYLEPGQVSIHDDRWLTRPWGVLGGEPGERSTKLLRRADGTEEVLPAKCDEVQVQPGDMLVFRTAGGGGWKDRLDRPVEAVARDVAFGLVSPEKALAGYGVVVRGDGSVDEEATAAERERQRTERGPAKDFDFGPPLDEALAACEAETGLPAPSPARPLRWAPLEDPEAAMARARAAAEADGGAAVAPG